MANGKLIIPQDIADTLTVVNNPKNTANNIAASDSILDKDTTSLDASIAGQSVASTILGGVETAAVVAPDALPKVASGLGKTNVVLSGWGARNDFVTMREDYSNPEDKIKASSVLSFSSNIAGGLAGGAVAAAGLGVATVGAPIIVTLGVASFALWGASMLVDEDLTANDMIVHGLGDLGDAIGDKIINLLDPPEELPEMSGSQQNQLMAISKGPSFNYTSHKKDSVAGYNLYQMLDNAEDTITNSAMNGFPVYVMGKTIQPTCMGDEAGIGGGVISGTVGKEIRATSGAPSIFYCGYMSIRAGDDCTMNNENVEGTYISLCG